MRQSPIGPNGPRRDVLPPRTSTRRPGGRWLPCLAMLAALASPASLWAQREGAGRRRARRLPAAATPLARYFPKDNLIFYVEFSGLDAHADAWNKTAAYKILTETPLGEMLEAVGAQLLDKALSYMPGHKLSGADIIALMEHAVSTASRWGSIASSVQHPQKADSVSAQIVIRGAASKEARGLWSRAMGSLMIGGKPQLEKREGRTLVVVPQLRPRAAEVKEQGLLVGREGRPCPLLCLPVGPRQRHGRARRQGPQRRRSPARQGDVRRDGNFEPVGIAFVDFEHVPRATAGVTALAKFRETGGSSGSASASASTTTP